MAGGDRADNVALPLTSENRAFPRAWETADFEKGTDGRLRALWHTSISVDFKIGSPAIFSAAAAALNDDEFLSDARNPRRLRPRSSAGPK